MKSTFLILAVSMFGAFVVSGCAPTEQQAFEEQAIRAEVQSVAASFATAEQAVGNPGGCYCSASGMCCCNQGGETTCVTCQRCQNGGVLGRD
jgi:hypothetical protein